MYPKFLGIGAMRSGSSWLYYNLKKHPELWLPPIKEIHYFNGLKNGPTGVFKKFFSNKWPTNRYRNLLLKRIKANLLHFSFEDLLWDYNYFFGNPHDAWYASLFKSGDGKKTGEITPAYATLDEEDVSHIFNLMPYCKVIFILRNPIERAWSQAVSEFVRKGLSLDSLSNNEWINLLRQKSTLVRSDYLRTIRIWKKYYSDEYFFIGYYDDISIRPRKILSEIFEFLGVNASDKYITDISRKRFNIGLKRTIPSNLARFLARFYYPQLIQMQESNEFSKIYIERWIDSANRALHSHI